MPAHPDTAACDLHTRDGDTLRFHLSSKSSPYLNRRAHLSSSLPHARCSVVTCGWGLPPRKRQIRNLKCSEPLPQLQPHPAHGFKGKDLRLLCPNSWAVREQMGPLWFPSPHRMPRWLATSLGGPGSFDQPSPGLESVPDVSPGWPQ